MFQKIGGNCFPAIPLLNHILVHRLEVGEPLFGELGAHPQFNLGNGFR
jgi:hypothetical protein